MTGGAFRVDRGVASDVSHDRDCAFRLLGVIDGDGIAAMIMQLRRARRSVAAMPVDDLADAASRACSRTSAAKRAHRAGERRASSGMMLLAVPACIEATVTTTDFSGSVSREAISLQARDDLRGNDDRIDGGIGPGGMAAAAMNDDLEMVGGRHHRARSRRELADRQTRPVVHAIDLADREGLHHAVLHHRVAAAAAFFGGLEDDRDGAARSCASRPDIWRRRAASRYGRRGRRRASCRASARSRACR